MDNTIFNSTEHAFSLKTKEELKRSIFLFKMMSRPWMVSLGTFLTKASLKTHLPVKGIIKKTIFQQFCGGETQQECIPVMQKIYQKNVHTVFDYASELRDKEDPAYDRDLQVQIDMADFAAQHPNEVPFLAIKPSNLGRIKIWECASSEEEMTKEEKVSWQRIKKRFHTLSDHIANLGLRLQIDAEESWTQKAVDRLVEELMEKHNKEKAVIYNTVQCYRVDRLAYVKDLKARAASKGYRAGIKLVRGAYMEKENQQALTNGYPSPICKDKATTDANFNAILQYCIEHLDLLSLYIGTHNEESTCLALDLMHEHGLLNHDDRIWFSQLYGMGDHITFNLASGGYNAAKYMPFGKVEEVVPYLIRRAEENSSVKGQTGRELTLLKEERQRRKEMAQGRVNLGGNMPV